MNRFPLWKYLLLMTVVSVAVIYALPNLYKADPSIQVTSNSRSAALDAELVEAVSSALDSANITHQDVELSDDDSFLFVRLGAASDQLPAQEVVVTALKEMRAQGKRYVVALNQTSTVPDWLTGLGGKPMNLGLDLAGGVHFLLEVDTPKALSDRLEDMYEGLKKGIRDERLFNVDIKLNAGTFVITSQKAEYKAKLVELLKDKTPSLMRDVSSNGDGSFIITAKLSDATIQEIEDHAVAQNLTTIRNRVNELGVSEPLVQRQGRNRIVVELPGIQDAAGAKKILGKTANLEFRMEAKPNAPSTQKEKFDFYTEEDQRRGARYLERRRIINGEHVIDATAGFDDESNSAKIDIKLDSEGGTLMNHATRNDIGRRMGVLFIDYYTETVESIVDGEVVETAVPKIDKKIINLATVRGALGVTFQITGLQSQEANDVALLLRAGSLAAPMKFVEERTIGPSLGAENIANGVLSVEIGLVLVLVFMLLYYKAFGFAANIALVMNMALLTALMSGLGATLTLPGIAGIVLTVGMAVDANVLIFSRIKEEARNGLPPQSAINSGFERAFTTILDANLTTLIVAFILFAIGTGPIKGFAVTLSLGILTSMFTAIVGTRAVVNLIYGNRKISKLWI